VDDLASISSAVGQLGTGGTGAVDTSASGGRDGNGRDGWTAEAGATPGSDEGCWAAAEAVAA